QGDQGPGTRDQGPTETGNWKRETGNGKRETGSGNGGNALYASAGPACVLHATSAGETRSDLIARPRLAPRSGRADPIRPDRPDRVTASASPPGGHADLT